MLCELAREDVLLGNGPLLVQRVPLEVDDLHAVQQRLGNAPRAVCSADEHNLKQGNTLRGNRRTGIKKQRTAETGNRKQETERMRWERNE